MNRLIFTRRIRTLSACSDMLWRNTIYRRIRSHLKFWVNSAPINVKCCFAWKYGFRHKKRPFIPEIFIQFWMCDMYVLTHGTLYPGISKRNYPFWRREVISRFYCNHRMMITHSEERLILMNNSIPLLSPCAHLHQYSDGFRKQAVHQKRIQRSFRNDYQCFILIVIEIKLYWWPYVFPVIDFDCLITQ